MAHGIRRLFQGSRSANADEIVRHTVGNAMVLHRTGRISPEAQSLAIAVAADPVNDIVVLDLGVDLPPSSWEAVAAALPYRRRGIRVLACGQHRGIAALIGQWLSERLNRTVVAPDGVLVRGAAGALFVDSAGSGWVQFRRGKAPILIGKRYPAPPWDGAVTDVRASSAKGEIEPLPGAVWIRPVGDHATVARYRNRLAADVPCTHETMTVLIGCPGLPALHLDDVARFWRDLEPETRVRARFVWYGDIRLAAGQTFGQTLADTLETAVVCYSGVPVGDPQRYEIKTVRADGTLGWEPYALELGYSPRRHGAHVRRPQVLHHRPPLDGAEQIEDRVYWYAPDAVVEVVPAGLWIRPPRLPAGAGKVRGVALDSDRLALFYDDTVAARAHRMGELAADLAARLDAGTRDHGVVLPASAAPEFGRSRPKFDPSAGLVPAAEPAPTASGRIGGESNEEPTARIGMVRGDSTTSVQLVVAAPPISAVLRTVTAERPLVPMPTVAPEPAPAAAAPAHTIGFRLQRGPGAESAALIVVDRSLGDERAWLREELNGSFADLARPVSRILSEHPGLQGDPSVTIDEALADSVAVRLFLHDRGPAVNSGLRIGENGPHVPFGRCVLAGLSRLPPYRGATIYRTTPAAGEWELYRGRSAVRDWGFVSALTAPCAAQDGDTDVVIWSLAGRRTALLEPDDAHHIEDRVVFAPGTGFKVLDLREPAPGQRGAILVRELAANEISGDGTVSTKAVPFDQLVLTSLRRSLDNWANEQSRRRIGPAAMDQFESLPGLARQGADTLSITALVAGWQRPRGTREEPARSPSLA